jgi:hypothetical protein
MLNSYKPRKAQVYKKRTVTTYAELWHGSRVLLERAQAERKGSYWLWMGSLLFSAFTFEAYLNHIGPNLFLSWDALATLRTASKLTVVCEKLRLELSEKKRPRKTVHELFIFRNSLAHGKTVPIKENIVRDADDYLDEFLGERPLATWEKYCTEKNALRIREDVEEVIRLIHAKAKPENDPVFFTGYSLHSASLQKSA